MDGITPYLLENYATAPETGCWLWLGKWDRYGYGNVSKHGRRLMGAHKMFYVAHKGSVPDGLFVCHACDTPPCVNPDHLFLGSQKENLADMCRKGRHIGGPNAPGRHKGGSKQSGERNDNQAKV